MSAIYDRAWSIEKIDAEEIPKVSRDLLPWLLKDRKEAVEGCYQQTQKGKEHDGSGLEKAERSFKQAEMSLAAKPTDPKIIKFLEEQRGAAEGKIGFYKGKIHLLDKIIASLQ